VKAIFADASNGRAVAASAVRARAGVLDEARCDENPSRIGARFNLLHEAGVADECEVFGVGAGFHRDNASAGFAHPYLRMKVLVAEFSVLDRCEFAPICWLARIIGAFVAVVTIHGREVACPVYVVAHVIGACVGVVARDAFAEVLSALAGHTNTGKAVVSAVRSVVHRSTHTRRTAPPTITTAILVGAFVAVAWAHDALTGPALKPGALQTPYRWNQAQRAEAGDPEQVAHG